MRKALIIGASSGYGKGIANTLECNGWQVIRASRTINGFDVTDEKSVASFFELGNKFDAIVYSAGIAIDNQTVESGGYHNWLRVFQTNALGIMLVAKYGMIHLNPSGTFIQIGSIAYAFSYKGGIDYCASKAAANSIMKGLREEYFGTTKRIVSIEPGLGDTNFQLARYNGNIDKAKSHYGNIQQLLPCDLGSTVLHVLTSPPHVNYDLIVVKPTEQLTHGKNAK